MTRLLSPTTWLDHLEAVDRVTHFILQGGACIRIVTARDAATHQHLDVQLDSLADRHGFRRINVSYTSCGQLHMPHMIVKSLAYELNLGDLFERITRRVWESAGYTTVGVTLADVRTHHADDLVTLRRHFRNAVDDLLRDGPPLGHEFTAVTKNIVGAMIDSAARGADAVRLLEHALAQTATAREVADLGLLRRISPYTATPTLRKILALHNLAGWPGVVLHLDLRWSSDPLLVDPHRNGQPPRSQRRDIYQWTRELVDLTPELTSTFVCVEFGETFLDTSPTGRGIGSYDALRLRMAEDAAPRDGANPSAPLIPLEGKVIRK